MAKKKAARKADTKAEEKTQKDTPEYLDFLDDAQNGSRDPFTTEGGITTEGGANGGSRSEWGEVDPKYANRSKEVEIEDSESGWDLSKINPDFFRDNAGRLIPPYRWCTVCFPKEGGYGPRIKWQFKKGGLSRRCYKCNQCGYEWQVDVREVVERINGKDVVLVNGKYEETPEEAFHTIEKEKAVKRRAKDMARMGHKQ